MTAAGDGVRMSTTEHGPAWFTVPGGRHEGRRHLNGWMLTAIKTLGTGVGDDGWLSLAICPVCHATVIADDEHSVGDQTWAHEQWHARTDHPDPEVDPEAGLPYPVCSRHFRPPYAPLDAP